MSDERCQHVIHAPKCAGGGSRICGRLMTDLCGFCLVYNADDWAAIYNEYRDTPRVAVDGDIL